MRKKSIKAGTTTHPATIPTIGPPARLFREVWEGSSASAVVDVDRERGIDESAEVVVVRPPLESVKLDVDIKD
jgi:hypothetical protein